MSFDMKEFERRMDGAVDNLKKEFSGLRTGRASVNFLDPIVVEAYGSKMPLSQVGTVNAPEPRMLTVQVWDNSMIKAVEKAIRDSGLGLNPMQDGSTIRIPLPELNQERRQELVKVAGKYTEQGRIAVRNVRRDAMDLLKKLEKDKKMSEDDQKRKSDEVQKATDKRIELIESLLSDKEKDIMAI